MQTATRAPLCSLLFSGVFDGANEGALARKDKPRAKTIPVNRSEHNDIENIEVSTLNANPKKKTNANATLNA